MPRWPHKTPMPDEEAAVLQASMLEAADRAVASSDTYRALREAILEGLPGPYTKPGGGAGYWHRHPWEPGKSCLGCAFEDVDTEDSDGD